MHAAEDRFTTRLWAGIDATYAEILHHPFLDGLADGTLDRQVFRFYVIEDALYLHEFARAVAILGGKAASAPGRSRLLPGRQKKAA